MKHASTLGSTRGTCTIEMFVTVPPRLPAIRPPLAGRSFAGRRRGAAARGSGMLRGLADTFAYSWARAVRNRVTHALTGNSPSSAVWILSLALAGPVFWDVHRGSRFIVDEAMSTAAAAASDWAPRGPSRSRAMPWQWHPCCCARLPLAFGPTFPQPPTRRSMRLPARAQERPTGYGSI